MRQVIMLPALHIYLIRKKEQNEKQAYWYHAR